MGAPVSLNLAQQARVAVGLSQRQFAKLLGVAPSVVCRWEAGRPPSGAARALLLVVIEHPGIVTEVLNGGAAGGSTPQPGGCNMPPDDSA